MSPSFQRPRTFAVVRAIGWVSFLEIIRDKVLYNVLVCCFLLFGVGFLASRLTFIRPERVILDFGISSIMISSAMIAILTGSSLIGREFERRTVYVALCHPISRTQFVLGKFMGLAGVLCLNWMLVSGSFLLILKLSSQGAEGLFSGTLFLALFFTLIQSLLMSSISIFFSTFSTTSLAVIMSIGFYLIGNNISQMRLIAARLHSPLGTLGLNTAATVLPNLEYFNLGTKVTYGLPLSWQFITMSVLYGSFMIALLLILAGIVIQFREV